jgi:hypothetical protein
LYEQPDSDKQDAGNLTIFPVVARQTWVKVKHELAARHGFARFALKSTKAMAHRRGWALSVACQGLARLVHAVAHEFRPFLSFRPYFPREKSFLYLSKL